MSKNLRGLSERNGLISSLFNEISSIIKGEDGLIHGNLKELSGKTLTGKSSFSATKSFYDFLKKEHTGRKLFICNGTACLTSGKQDGLKHLLSVELPDEEPCFLICM